MNPMDILGGMLRRKMGGPSSGGRSGGGRSGSGGLGGSILESILKGGRSGRSSSGGSVNMQRPPGSPEIRSSRDHEQFDSLEDLLRAGYQSNSRRSGHRTQYQAPTPEPHVRQRQSDFNSRFERDPHPFNAKARLLVVAMVNAAKADGQIDQKEQDAIVGELGELSQEEIQFLKTEFAKPLNVRDFVWDVPVGMEREIYAVSLMAIDLDRQAEAEYLTQLARGFRMTLDECNRIHREFGAPMLRSH